MERSSPCATTIRRALQCVDAERLDDVVSDCFATRQQAATPRRRQRRRAPTAPRAAASMARLCAGDAPLHQLAALDHDGGVVLRQTAVVKKTNEINAFASLPDAFDVIGTLVIADALTYPDQARAVEPSPADTSTCIPIGSCRSSHDAQVNNAQVNNAQVPWIVTTRVLFANQPQPTQTGGCLEQASCREELICGSPRADGSDLRRARDHGERRPGTVRPGRVPAHRLHPDRQDVARSSSRGLGHLSEAP
jgi:hypothetical protein